MLFDLYNFENNIKSRDKYYEFLQKEPSDVLCFQEFYTNSKDSNLSHQENLSKLLKMNVHFEKTKSLYNYHFWGIATYSKYPIINKGKLDFKQKTDNICIFTDLKIGKDTVRIYNAHLQSLLITDVETIYSYKFVENTSKIFSLKNKIHRFNLAFEKRAIQSKIISDHIQNCKYKIILCGDFNDTSSSFAYQLLTNNLEDSFLEKGFGFGISYNGKIPFQRIDYILHSDEIECTNFEVKNSFKVSDHFPIVGNYNIN